MNEENGETEKLVECEDCGEMFDLDDLTTLNDGKKVCSDCFDDNYTTCEDCGEIVHNDDTRYTGDSEYICENCYDHHYCTCNDCGEIYHNDHMHIDDYHQFCQNCFENSYTYCAACGDIIHVDDSYNNDNGSYCEHCWDEDNDDEDNDDESSHGGYLHQYGYHPVLKFQSLSGENCDLHFGTECEIDKGQHDNFKFRELNSDHFWCDYDGSLSSQGIEIISHPMTYNYIMENRPHKKMCEIALKSGYKSHNTTTCGTHIHMSRKAFNYDDEKITKFIYLFEKFWKEIVRFSRRKHDHSVFDTSINAIDHYACRYCTIEDEKEKKINFLNVDDKKKKKGFNRYQCVNITNGATIEVRIFRGTLKEETIIASIQLCKMFFELSSNDVKTIEKMTWQNVKEYAKFMEYVEFSEYCEHIGL